LCHLWKKITSPNNAYFSGRDNGYDAWDDIVLAWEIDIPTTEKDKLSFKRKRFTNIAWKFVYDLLIKNGYKRVGYNTSLLKEFDDTTVYDMYINEDFDRLVKYYSLPFVKEI
jgi:intergrase/recombinase